MSYFIPLIIEAIFIICFFSFLKNKEKKIQKRAVFIILIVNFGIHFLKLLFPPYINELPQSLSHVSLENICAISVVISPFVFLLPDDSPVHEYMIFITFVGGLFALLYPTTPMNEGTINFEVIRFYVCHGILLASSLLSILFKIRTLKIKNLWIIPVGFLAYETIIFLNELVLFKCDLLKAKTWDVFLDSNTNNNSFTFGVTPDMLSIKPAFDFLTPGFMKTVHNGYDSCWPVIWLIGPSIFIITPLYLLIFSPLFIVKILKINKKSCSITHDKNG